MKTHLPVILLRYLLGAIVPLHLFSNSAFAVVTVPDSCTSVPDVSGASALPKSNYTSYRYAFILKAPESSEDNTVYLVDDTTKSKNYLISNGALFFTSDTDAPVNLDMSGMTNGGVWYSTDLAREFNVYGVNDFTLSGNTNGNLVTATSSTTNRPLTYTYHGALASRGNNSVISISNNSGNVSLLNNVVSKYNTEKYHVRGAAIGILGKNSTLTIDNNQEVTISGNQATGAYSVSSYTGTVSSKNAEGGAVYVYQSGQFSISDNKGLVTISKNEATHEHGRAFGGAVAMNSATMNMAGNKAGVLIHTNKAESRRAIATMNIQAAGGAIYGITSTASLNITGTGGTASYGGKTGAVIMAENAAVATGYGAQGGAARVIMADISGNLGDVLITDNYTTSGMNYTSSSGTASAASAGGAFYVGHSVSGQTYALRISGNEGVTLSGNHADAAEGYAMGGAVYAELARGKVDISGNTGKVEITGNYAKSAAGTAVGGAVYALGGISIEGNEDVLLRGNYEQSGDSFRLRSLYYSTKYGSNENTSATGHEDVSQFRLMAAAGKKIEIHDSVYSGRSGAGVQVVFNGSYTAADGSTVTGDGTIRFTGANTVADLKTAKLNAGIAEDEIVISDEEIANSRCSEFKTNIQLQGGRLEIVDSAQIKGAGLTVENRAAVQLRNGILNHADSVLSFASDTMLEIVGQGNVVSAGSLAFDNQSTLKFVYGEGLAENAALTFTGTLSLAESAVIQLSGFAGHASEAQRLISMQNSTLQGWNTGTLTFVDETGAALDASHFVWKNDVLFYKTSPTILTWSNGAGDGKWNNSSANWTTGDEIISPPERVDVVFGSNENTHETITLEGELTVRNMTVQQGGNYAYTASTAGTSLSLESLTVETGATVDIQLGGGALNANEISSAGTVTISGASLNGESSSITAGNVEISQNGATLSNVTVKEGRISAADTAGGTKGSISNSMVRLQDQTTFTIENMVLTNTTLAAASSTTEVKLKNVEGSTARLTMGAFTLDATPQVDAQADGETHRSLSYTNGLAVSGNSDATLTLNLDVLGAVEKSGTYDLTITLSGYGSDFVLPENISSLVSFDTTSWLYEALVSQNANFGGATAAVRTLAAVETAGVPTVQYAAGTGDNVGSLVITISGLNVPEPTTSTLGLLALAALAARRRRK